MDDVTEVLKEHINKYPLMEVKDVVKLIYQNEFAGGHLVDAENSFSMLKKEWESFGKNCKKGFERIGNNLVRDYLNIKEENLETLNNFFIYTSSEHLGTIEGFNKKLNLFIDLCENNELPFDSKEVKNFILEYENGGYKPISHSERYRNLYNRRISCKHIGIRQKNDRYHKRGYAVIIRR